MGFLAKVGTWIKTNLPTIVKVAKKVSEFVHAAATMVEAHLEGKKIFDEQPDSGAPNRERTERPDFLHANDTESELSELASQLEESKRNLTQISESNSEDHHRISLQIDVMELIVSAQTFERFTNNVQIHAANLQIHLHTIKNTAGLLDSVNRQRTAVKALMKTVNHLINVVGAQDKVDPIKGINIDIKEGAISIADAYSAFEHTRDLLVAELASYGGAVDEQLSRVERVRVSAKKVPGLSKQVSKWLEGSVEPSLHDAHRVSKDLKSELEMIPRLEAELRHDLRRIENDEIEF